MNKDKDLERMNHDKNKYTFNCFFDEVVQVEICDFQFIELIIVNEFSNLPQ